MAPSFFHEIYMVDVNVKSKVHYILAVNSHLLKIGGNRARLSLKLTNISQNRFVFFKCFYEIRKS